MERWQDNKLQIFVEKIFVASENLRDGKVRTPVFVLNFSVPVWFVLISIQTNRKLQKKKYRIACYDVYANITHRTDDISYLYTAIVPVSYTHLDVYKRQGLG